MDIERKTTADVIAGTQRARSRAKAVAAYLAGLRNLTNPHAQELATELADIGLASECMAADLRVAIKYAAAGLAR